MVAVAAITFYAAVAWEFCSLICVGSSGCCGCNVRKGVEWILVVTATVFLYGGGVGGVSISIYHSRRVETTNNSWTVVV